MTLQKQRKALQKKYAKSLDLIDLLKKMQRVRTNATHCEQSKQCVITNAAN